MLIFVNERGGGEWKGTYAVEGYDIVREELEAVGRARELVGEAALGASFIVACEVHTGRSLRWAGDVVQRDLKDAVPVRAEAEFQLAVLDEKVGINFRKVDHVRIYYFGDTKHA